jgi:hypothetical protein
MLLSQIVWNTSDPLEQGGKIFREASAITDVVKDQLLAVRTGTFPAKADLEKLKKRKVREIY